MASDRGEVMILTYACLALGFVLPTGSILRDMANDNAATRTEHDIARITAPPPPVRHDLSEWPVPLSPLDLPGIGDTDTLAVVELGPRVRQGRHRLGIAVGTDVQRALWDSPTGQFRMLIEAGWSEDERQSLSQEWWCSSCLDDHRDCSGICACPCTLVVAR